MKDVFLKSKSLSDNTQLFSIIIGDVRYIIINDKCRFNKELMKSLKYVEDSNDMSRDVIFKTNSKSDLNNLIDMFNVL